MAAGQTGHDEAPLDDESGGGTAADVAGAVVDKDSAAEDSPCLGCAFGEEPSATTAATPVGDGTAVVA